MARPRAAGQLLQPREPRAHPPTTQTSSCVGKPTPPSSPHRSRDQPGCYRPGVESRFRGSTTTATTARSDSFTPTCSARVPPVIHVCLAGLEIPVTATCGKASRRKPWTQTHDLRRTSVRAAPASPSRKRLTRTTPEALWACGPQQVEAVLARPSFPRPNRNQTPLSPTSPRV